MVVRTGLGTLDPKLLTPASLSPRRGIPGDPWSVEASCRALCPGVMSLATQRPSLGSTPKCADTWTGSGTPSGGPDCLGPANPTPSQPSPPPPESLTEQTLPWSLHPDRPGTESVTTTTPPKKKFCPGPHVSQGLVWPGAKCSGSPAERQDNSAGASFSGKVPVTFFWG